MVGRTPSAHNAAIKTILDANRDRICSLPPVSRRIALERYRARSLCCSRTTPNDAIEQTSGRTVTLLEL